MCVCLTLCGWVGECVCVDNVGKTGVDLANAEFTTAYLENL